MDGFTIIVAHDAKRGIGKNNTIPWFLKEDLQHFKNTTLHGIVIMGRKTWESLPDTVRPLPMRENVIISKKIKEMKVDADDMGRESENEDLIFKCIDFAKENIHIEGSLDTALSKWINRPDKNVFVIGGASIYSQAIESPLCKRLIITHVDGEYDCDTLFPEYESKWIKTTTIQQGNGYIINEYRKKE